MPTAPLASPGPTRRRKVKLVDQIIETLRQDIVTRRLPDGERLPSEKELSERFGVSQPTVREAIRALETIGLVEVLHGNGTFVRSRGDFALASALQTLLQLESVGLMEVLDMRQVLGLHSIGLAVSNATDADMAEIERTCQRFEHLSDAEALEDIIGPVLAFQRAVSTASHSTLLKSLETFLLVLLSEVQIQPLGDHDVRFWKIRALDFQPNRVAIVAALRARDPEAAQVAMRDYFEAQRRRFMQDDKLRLLDLSSPGLIDVVANMVDRFRLFGPDV